MREGKRSRSQSRIAAVLWIPTLKLRDRLKSLYVHLDMAAPGYQFVETARHPYTSTKESPNLDRNWTKAYKNSSDFSSSPRPSRCLRTFSSVCPRCERQKEFNPYFGFMEMLYDISEAQLIKTQGEKLGFNLNTQKAKQPVTDSYLYLSPK